MTALGQPSIDWDFVQRNINEVDGIINDIIRDNPKYQDILEEMNVDVVKALRAASHEITSPTQGYTEYVSISAPLQDVIDNIKILREEIQPSSGGYRKRRTHRKRHTHRKRRTHRKRHTHRKRTHRNRK